MVKHWLALFAEHFRQPISELSAAAYAQGLADLTPKQLDLACAACLRSCRYMPTVADIRSQIAQADAKGSQIEAEGAWDWALEVAQRCYFADLGGVRDAPPIPAEIEFAVKASGGWRRLHTCSEDELVWCRKTFLERFTLLRDAGEVEHLLTRGQARRILAQIAAGPEKPAPQRLNPVPTGGPQPSTEEIVSGFAALRKTALDVSPVGPPVPPEEELRRRAAVQKEALARWLAEHPRAQQPLEARRRQARKSPKRERPRKAVRVSRAVTPAGD